MSMPNNRKLAWTATDQLSLYPGGDMIGYPGGYVINSRMEWLRPAVKSVGGNWSKNSAQWRPAAISTPTSLLVHLLMAMQDEDFDWVARRSPTINTEKLSMAEQA